jgi:tRNA nucleotidyltransferase (CCA-adding enzyme)
MPNLAALMERALPRRFFEFIKDAGAQASAMGESKVQGLYLVGGQVRDLLLQRAVYDLDFMVAGDAREFAQVMAERVRGEARAATVFGTVKLKSETISADIAMARRERYPTPGALPVVEPGDAREDLTRRDFTINAMAIDVWPSRFGTLHDLFGGMRDITMKRLRFLHEKSFQDDPTRILRGLRYEARFGFQFEARTAEHATADAPYLEHVSGPRIRAELDRILSEPTRAAAVANAEERGVLAAIHPALRVAKRVSDAMGQAAPGDDGEASGDRATTGGEATTGGGATTGGRATTGGEAATPESRATPLERRATPSQVVYYVALIGAGLTEEESRAVVARLEPPRAWNEVLLAGPRLRQLLRLLENPDLKRSEVVDVLAPFPLDAIRAQYALAPATLQRDRLQAYLETLSSVRPECSGDDLIAAGVPRGPLVGELLDELKRARLDSLVKNRDEEIGFVKRRLPILQARASESL